MFNTKMHLKTDSIRNKGFLDFGNFHLCTFNLSQ